MTHETNYWSRFWRQRTGRRRILVAGGTAGAGAAGLALVGCGDDDDDDDGDNGSGPRDEGGGGGDEPTEQPTQPSGPVAGGEVVFNRGAPNQQPLDPHTTTSLAFFYSGLYSDKMVSPNRQDVEPLEGELVQSWEPVDETTITLNVREGVNHQAAGLADGRPFVAEDVAFNLMRIAGKLDPERIAQFQRSTTLANMAEAEAVDERTVRVTFDIPNSQFLQGMSDWRNWLVVREDVEDDPNFTSLTGKSGTGPFIITDFDDAQRIGTYERNPDYWKGAPYLERVIDVSIPDPASQLSAFLTDQTSFYGVDDPSNRAAVEDEDGVRISSWEHVGWEFFRVNQNFGPFQDPNVRKALHLAFNRETMMNLNYGEGFWDLTGPLVSGMPGAWSAAELATKPGFRAEKDEDIAEARAMLDAAGYPEGEGLDFVLTPMPIPGHAWNNNAITGQEELLQVFPKMGVDLLGGQDFTAFNRALASGDYEAITYASFPPPSALVEGGLHYRTAGGRNYTQFSDPDVDALFNKAFAEFDAEARADVVGELQELLLESVFAIPLGKARSSFAFRDRIKNFDGWSGPGSFAAYDPQYSAYQLWIDPNA